MIVPRSALCTAYSLVSIPQVDGLCTGVSAGTTTLLTTTAITITAATLSLLLDIQKNGTCQQYSCCRYCTTTSATASSTAAGRTMPHDAAGEEPPGPSHHSSARRLRACGVEHRAGRVVRNRV